MRNKIIAIVLTLMMVLTCLPLGTFAAFAEAYTAPTIEVETKYGASDSEVSVNVNVFNNPGIAGAKITLSYSDKLTLVEAVSGDVFGVLDYTRPGNYNSPCSFNWDSENAESAEDGTILSLIFTVSGSASGNEELPVNISYVSGDIYNSALEDIECDVVNGKITVIDYIPGDVNSDQTVNGKDVTLLRRFNAGGYDVTINEAAADVNDDDAINGKDVTLIRRYNAGGYDVVLLPHHERCHHELTAITAVAATCTEDGNIAYWHCSNCDGYFKDEDARAEITLEETVIEAKGHTVVIDEAVAATYENDGLTEGSHCSICNTVIVEQQIIPRPIMSSYSITYNMSNGDTYLATQTIKNPNPEYYYPTNGVTLQTLETPGYRFLGWFDLPSGGSAENVKRIDAGTEEDITLYAHWEKIPYTIQFESNLIPVANVSYTVDKGCTLPTPSIDGYIFAGWSDDSGSIITKVEKGITGELSFTANWISERNQAWTKNKLDAPIIIEDEETHTILFTYEIGEIRNIPLYVIHDFGKINASGVSQTVTKTYSTTISESLMNDYTKTVANAVSDSYGVTLSNGWTESTTLDTNWATEHGMTEEQAEEHCKSDTEGWYVSSGKSGSSSTVNTSSVDNYSLNTATRNIKLDGEFGAEQSATTNISINASLNASLSKTKTEPEKTSGNGFGGGIGASGSSDETYKRTEKAGYEVSANNVKQTGSVSHNTTDSSVSSGWNNDSGKNASATVSDSNSVLKAVSEKINETHGYGESYIKTGSESSNQTKTTSKTDTDQYSNTVTYSTSTSESETVTWTTSNTASGYHRWIMAGTAHVFAIVGYDIETRSYFITTYSVMDDEMHRYEDYSYSTSAYNDNQNGQISFEIPYEVNEFVAERVCETKGLEIDKNGIITNYTGTADYVVIPEFKVVTSLDGSTQVIKVTGISETAFQGNSNIVAVALSDYITKIPNNAFKNCTSLVYSGGISITSIGDNAFAGCTSLDNAEIGNTVTHIGTNAFGNVSSISVDAASVDIVDSAVNSGAKSIAVYISEKCGSLDNKTLTISNSTEKFIFSGMGKNYKNLIIDSKATDTTAIYRTNITSTGSIPVKASSKNIELDECSITSPGITLVASASNSNIKLYGETELHSSSPNVLLCKNATMSQIKDDFASKLIVNGNVLTYGNVSNTQYIDCSGSITKISEAQFNKYASGSFKLTYNANGGSVSQTSKTVKYGLAVGTLPMPTRDYYVFAGWYTAASGGKVIKADTIPTECADITLYAHWTQDTYTLTFNANGGSVSETKRTAICNAELGTLPTPTREYYTFNGWFTAKDGGTKVTSTSTFTSDTTIYAHWTQKTYTLTFNANGGSVSETTRTAKCNAEIGTLPTPTRENHTFDGWYTAASGGTKVTSTSKFTSATTIYAHWTLSTFTVTFNANGGTVSPTTLKATCGRKLGTLPTPSRTGFTFSGWYTAASGGTQVTADTTYSTAKDITVYAHWTCKSYTASWSTGTGYSITVKRTSSPNGGAATGTISSGGKIYYGDVLSITYSASTGYTLGSKGKTSITVTGNVTSSDIYASASANSYTYNIKYVSTNGTNLGSSTATYKFGTTNTISAPAKSGYNTPSSQSVKWDSTSAKTITFKYTPTSQPTRQTIASGNWWTSSSGNTRLKYKVEAEWCNRTADSVDIRIIWTNTITNEYNEGRYGYKQEFEWWGWHQIAAASAFSSAGGTRTATVTSDWHTYSMEPGDTSWTTGSEWRDNNGKSGDWEGTIYFPAY